MVASFKNVSFPGTMWLATRLRNKIAFFAVGGTAAASEPYSKRTGERGSSRYPAGEKLQLSMCVGWHQSSTAVPSWVP